MLKSVKFKNGWLNGQTLEAAFRVKLSETYVARIKKNHVFLFVNNILLINRYTHIPLQPWNHCKTCNAQKKKTHKAC